MIPVTFCFSVALIISGAIAFDVIVTTNPEGPSYKAGSLFSVICSTVGIENNHFYQWSFGCSYTGIFTNYVTGASTISYYATTTSVCTDIYRCKVTDLTLFTSVVGQVTIETVTDIAIQLLLSPNFVYVIQNVSILTVSASGQFIDVICNTGLKQPNIGHWINPNGTDIAFDDETLEIQRGGGIVSLPYTTLKLRDGYSLDPQDTGLFTCKMPDINMVERESHIWILPEQDFKPADPEYFTSYSGQNSVKMICAYSNTPGEVTWYNFYYGAEEFTANNKTTISQRLTQSSPVIYEGVLELDYIDVHIIADCIMYSRIIGNTLDPYPSENTIYERHYFFLSWIGQPESFSCSLGVSVITSQVYTNGQLLNTVNGSKIGHTIDIVMDVTHNQEYNCIGITLDNQKSYVNITIVGLIPASPLTMHIIAIDPVITAGEPLTIDLIAIKNSGFTYDQTISCTDDNGVPINDLEGFLYPEHPAAIGTTLHVQVPIMTIKLSHAGLYLCTTFLETPHQVDNLSNSANFSITVKIPSPIVYIINTSNHEMIVEAGAVVSLNCTVIMNTSNIDIPVDPIFSWIINSVPITSSGRFKVIDTIAIADNNQNITNYYSELQIAPVLKEDESTLVCNVFITAKTFNEYILSSENVNSTTSLVVEGSEDLQSKHIEINLMGLTIPCYQWILQNQSENLNTIANILLNVLTERCDCQYFISHIANEHFECSNKPMNVAFRATLYSSNVLEADILVDYVDEWINSTAEPIMLVNLDQSQISLSINMQCGQVLLDTFNESVCTALVAPSLSSKLYISSATIKTEYYTTADVIKNESKTTVNEMNSKSISINETQSTVTSNETAAATNQWIQLPMLSIILGCALFFVILIIFFLAVILIMRKRRRANKPQYERRSKVIEPTAAVLNHNAGSSNLYDNCHAGYRELPMLPKATSIDLLKNISMKESRADDELDTNMEIYVDMDMTQIDEEPTYESMDSYR